jgi:hypothetical protein
MKWRRLLFTQSIRIASIFFFFFFFFFFDSDFREREESGGRGFLVLGVSLGSKWDGTC